MQAALDGGTARINTPSSLAAQVGAKRLVPFHHDPSHDDDMLDRLLEDSIRRFKSPCSVAAGREGAVFSI
jgi:hypothetical protein